MVAAARTVVAWAMQMEATAADAKVATTAVAVATQEVMALAAAMLGVVAEGLVAPKQPSVEPMEKHTRRYAHLASQNAWLGLFHLGRLHHSQLAMQ